ncbi:MAG: glycosyltransferase family 4 protein [Bacteroidota bacterium]|nr:glycosyltransferase family 4 protein [Bacteroidota bacterium]
MRIFLTSTDNPYQKQVGGKHIHQLLFEKALRELGHHVDFFYPTFHKRKKIVTAWKLSTHFLPLNSFGFLEYRLKTDAKQLFARGTDPFSEPYDVLHAQDPLSLLYTQNIKCKKRIITLHGYFTKESINYSKLPGKYIPEFIRWSMNMEKEAYALADFFICVDSNIRDYLINEFNIPVSKIAVIFNAIDTRRFSPIAPGEIERLRNTYGYTTDQYIILVPRRLVKKNGVHIALQALKLIQDENTILLIAGDGPERDNLMKECGTNHRVQFLGAVNHDQVIDYFRLTDTVLIPSITSDGFQEATSLAMLEGMSMGKPTICSAIGGMKEVVKHNETGFLVEEQNPKAIAQQIKWIQRNPEAIDKLIFNARNYIMENHHYRSHAQKITNYYGI